MEIMCMQYNMNIKLLFFSTHYVSYYFQTFYGHCCKRFLENLFVCSNGRDSHKNRYSLNIFHIISIEIVYFTLCLDHKQAMIHVYYFNGYLYGKAIEIILHIIHHNVAYVFVSVRSLRIIRDIMCGKNKHLYS